MSIVVTAKSRLDKVNTLYKVIDTTDYAAQGVDFGGVDTVFGYITGILFSDGINTSTIYANPVTSGTPDMDLSFSGNNTIPITLPLNSDGSLKKGQYSLYYTIVTDIASVTGEQTFSAVDIYDYDFPEVCLSHEIKCATSQIASQDSTNYGAYASTISRVHTLYPPPAAHKSNATNGLTLLIYNNICTNTWTQEVISTVLFVFSATFEVSATISGSDEFEVICDTDICKIKCCMDKRFKEYQNCKNPAQAQRTYNDVIIPAQTALLQFLIAQYCGNATQSALKIAELKEILGCSGECDDCDSDPTSVIPTSPAAAITYDIDSPDGSVSVTSEYIGDVLTYHIQVSAALQDIINNLAPVNVVGSSEITVVESEVMGVKTFTIYANGPAIASKFEGVLKIYRNPSQPTPIGESEFLISYTEKVLDGDNMQTPTFGLGENVPNVLSDIAVIGASDWFIAPPGLAVIFSAAANVMRYSDNDAVYSRIKDVEAEIYNFNDDFFSFTIRLWNPVDGTPLTLNDLVSKGDIYLKVSLTA